MDCFVALLLAMTTRRPLVIRPIHPDIRPTTEPFEDRVTQATKNPALSAPSAPKRPHSFTRHGITVTDDYAWLKDPKWQEVLRDPSILDPDIRKYLEAENDYTESLLGHTAPLQKKLVAEMRGRIKADDSSVRPPPGGVAAPGQLLPRGGG